MANKMKYPCLIIVKEKHYDCYVLVESFSDIEKFAIKLLTERMESGWYWKPDSFTFEEYFQSLYHMTFKQAENAAELFNDSVKIENVSPADAIKNAKSRFNHHCSQLKEIDNINESIKKEDGKAAWFILQDRSSEGNEYERIDVESFENRDYND